MRSRIRSSTAPEAIAQVLEANNAALAYHYRTLVIEELVDNHIAEQDVIEAMGARLELLLLQHEVPASGALTMGTRL